MLEEKEKEEIIAAATERALLALPKVIGNLMEQQAASTKIMQDFYKQHPDFKDHRNIVQQVVERVDGTKPMNSLQEKLAEAVPIIREQIKTVGKLDTTGINKINRDLSGLFPKGTNNGEL